MQLVSWSKIVPSTQKNVLLIFYFIVLSLFSDQSDVQSLTLQKRFLSSSPENLQMCMCEHDLW